MNPTNPRELNLRCVTLSYAIHTLSLVEDRKSSRFTCSSYSHFVFSDLLSLSFIHSDCWTVVKLKRYIERVTATIPGVPAPMPAPVDESDAASASDAASNVTATTNITYPDVGDFLYGKQFQSYIAVCVCVQQLAICTVFLSFIGENLLAVLERLNADSWLDSHAMVTTLALPAVLSLSFMPNLRSLSPVMAAGTILMMLGFISLGVVGGIEWADRPEPPKLNPPQVPLAVCIICCIMYIHSSCPCRHGESVFCCCIHIVSNSFYFRPTDLLLLCSRMR
jgi:hypothetical protein